MNFTQYNNKYTRFGFFPSLCKMPSNCGASLLVNSPGILQEYPFYKGPLDNFTSTIINPKGNQLNYISNYIKLIAMSHSSSLVVATDNSARFHGWKQFKRLPGWVESEDWVSNCNYGNGTHPLRTYKIHLVPNPKRHVEVAHIYFSHILLKLLPDLHNHLDILGYVRRTFKTETIVTTGDLDVTGYAYDFAPESPMQVEPLLYSSRYQRVVPNSAQYEYLSLVNCLSWLCDVNDIMNEEELLSYFNTKYNFKAPEFKPAQW